MAEQCLGVVSDRRLTAASTEGAIAGRLLQAVREALQAEPARLARALSTFRQAKYLVLKEGGDPKTVLAASLLIELAVFPQDQHSGGLPALARIEALLAQAGMDQQSAERVCQLVSACQTGAGLDCPEFSVVHDAHLLAKLAMVQQPRGESAGWDEFTEQLRTPTAKEAAKRALGPEKPPTRH